MKISFFEVPQKEQNALKEAFSKEEVYFFEEKIDEDNVSLIKDSDIISVFVNSMVNKEIIDSLPNLKFISTRSTGYDHIDVDYCKEKNIKILSVPAYGSYTVAEFAFSLILNISRKIYKAYNNLRENTDFDTSSLYGFDLYGKTIGVIGTGKIGKNVIKIARGFSMNVIAYDLYPDLEFAKENNFEYKELNEVLSQSDIISLHALYNKGDKHLINKENISIMKKGIFIINTARGELIDTGALIWGINEGIIAGAGLDVLESERELKEEMRILSNEKRSEKIKDYKTLVEGHILIDMPNVLVTPHIASATVEARDRIIKTTIENINSCISGDLVNVVK
jgi:D-lactate dehydrogenase